MPKKPNKKVLPSIIRRPTPIKDYTEIDPLPEPTYHFRNAPAQSQAQVRSVILLEPDILDPALRLFFLVGCERMLQFARAFPQETLPEPFVRQAISRLVLQDPRCKLYLGLDEATGEVIAHVLATIESNGSDVWAFCWQAQVDPSGTPVLAQIIDAGSQWAKSQGATKVLMATQIDPSFWEGKYGFETVRYVMTKPL